MAVMFVAILALAVLKLTLQQAAAYFVEWVVVAL